MKKTGRGKLLIEAIALLAFLVAVFVVAVKLDPSATGPFSDPTAPRPSAAEEWNEVYGVGAAVAWSPDPTLWKRGVKTSDTGRVTYTYSGAAGLDRYLFPHIRHDLAAGERLEVDGGFLDIPAFSTGIVTAETGDSIPVSMRYFAGDLSTTDSSIIEELLGGSSLPHHHSPSGAPEANLIIRHEGLDNLLVTRLRVFDTRTHRMVFSGGGWRNLPDGLVPHGSNIQMWHSSPVDIVLDLAYGPCDVIEFDPIKGEGYSAPDADIRFIEALPDNGYSFSGGHRGSSSHVRLGLAKTHHAGTSYLFVCQPAVFPSPFTVELLAEDGEAISQIGATSGIHACARVPSKELRAVDRIRVTRRKTLRRVIFHLPYWPGLPAANDNVENLFDVTIPYVKIERVEELVALARSVLQCKGAQRAGLGHSLPRLYPREYVDTTFGEMLAEYTEVKNAAFSLSSDYDTLFIYPGSLEYALKKMWRRLF